jgi:hypothetical protein
MGDLIDLKKYKPLNKRDGIESDIAMFSVLWFVEHFGELLSGLDVEVRYALVISTYRFMLDCEKNGDVTINKEGFSIDNEASKQLQHKIKNAVDFIPEKLN